MSKTENNLGKFLRENSPYSVKEIAENIRSTDKVSNKYDNQIIQYKKNSIDAIYKKLVNGVQAFDTNSEVIIRTKKGDYKK